MSELINDSSNKKARLGRGLGSLLGPSQEPSVSKVIPEKNLDLTTQTTQKAPLTTQPIPADARIWKVAIDKLTSGEFQPRTQFEKEKLEELAISIKTNGILQPIVARKVANGRFEIIAGERRWRAAQIAGLHEVPVLLKEMENQVALELAIIENIQREDLNPIEEGMAYQRLIEEFKLTQQQVAEKVGKDRATVANSIRILSLPKDVRNHLLSGELSLGHAKVLLSYADAVVQSELAKKAIDQNLSVRQLEKLIQKAKELPKEAKHDAMDSTVASRLVAAMGEDLQKKLGTKVAIDYSQGKGKISIHFYSDEELTQLVERIKSGHGKHI